MNQNRGFDRDHGLSRFFSFFGRPACPYHFDTPFSYLSLGIRHHDWRLE
jgi:hypothetical protein